MTPPDETIEERLTPQLKAIVQEVLTQQQEASRKQIVPVGDVPVVGTPQYTLSDRVLRLEVKEEESNVKDKLEQLDEQLRDLKDKFGQLDTRLAARDDFVKARNIVLRWAVGILIALPGAAAILLQILPLLGMNETT